MKKIKVAVQIFGHLRTFEKCYEMLNKHLLELYDCDVFIHTWDKLEHDSQTWYSNDVKSPNSILKKELIDKVNNYYSPKRLLIETQNIFDIEGYFGTDESKKISLQGIKYMLYSQYMANKIRIEYQNLNNIQYDYVIVLRPDILLLQNIHFLYFESEFNFHERVSIHFVHEQSIIVRDKKIFYCPLKMDCLFFSKPQIVDDISNEYLEFEKYYINYCLVFPKGIFTPEIAFQEYLTYKGISSRHYLLNYIIKRNLDKNDIQLNYIDPNILWREIRDEMPYKKNVFQKIKNYIKLMFIKFIDIAPSFLLNFIVNFLNKFVRLHNFLNFFTSGKNLS